jgi:fluoride ion exporter CrcB/FEX
LSNPEEVLKKTKVVEIVVDCLWLVNMAMCFTTSFMREVEIENDLREIAYRYVVKDGFIIDFLTTFSTLTTFYHWPEIYYIKILRLYYISRS